MRLLVDSRTPERYRGIGETLMRSAATFPAPANYFFQQNLTAEKTFKSPDDLKIQWSAIVKGHDPRARRRALAAQASRPAITCWLLNMRGSRGSRFTRDRGRSGVRTPTRPTATTED